MNKSWSRDRDRDTNKVETPVPHVPKETKDTKKTPSAKTTVKVEAPARVETSPEVVTDPVPPTVEDTKGGEDRD